MKYGFAALAGLLVLAAVPAFAQSNCYQPVPPAALNGATATKDQMAAARSDVMDFIKSSDDYQDCMDAEFKEKQRKAQKDNKPLPPDAAKAVDDAIAANQRDKEKVGAEFNASVAAYKVKHPGG